MSKTTERRVRVGIIGCGNIFDQYAKAMPVYRVLDVRACADLDIARARDKANACNLKALGVDELLASQDIDLVVNLTIPSSHARVATAALKAGKHVYSEKPLALDRNEAARLTALAKRRGLLLGSAPDTFFGAGLQTCVDAIRRGAIGTPVSALAFMLGHGMEHWHPNPFFFYQKGAGPMFDMGPYYLTALVVLLGPAVRVCASTKISFAKRRITSQPNAGRFISPTTPTHVAGVVDFASGASASITVSFDAWSRPSLPPLVVYGSKGALLVPDPNRFDDPVRICREGKEPEDVPLSHVTGRGRGAGVADLAYSILRRRRACRVDSALGQHVVEIMSAFEVSSTRGRHVQLRTTCRQPAPLPKNLTSNELDP